MPFSDAIDKGATDISNNVTLLAEPELSSPYPLGAGRWRTATDLSYLTPQHWGRFSQGFAICIATMANDKEGRNVQVWYQYRCSLLEPR